MRCSVEVRVVVHQSEGRNHLPIVARYLARARERQRERERDRERERVRERERERCKTDRMLRASLTGIFTGSENGTIG